MSICGIGEKGVGELTERRKRKACRASCNWVSTEHLWVAATYAEDGGREDIVVRRQDAFSLVTVRRSEDAPPPLLLDPTTNSAATRTWKFEIHDDI